MPKGRAGETGQCGYRRYQDESQREQAQGDELLAEWRRRRNGCGRKWRGYCGRRRRPARPRTRSTARASAATSCRLKKIREAKEKAEKARVDAEAEIAERREKEAQTGKKAGGHDLQVPDPEQAQPEPKAQRNFTDPESRIMPDGANKGSFVQGYNAQAAVDSHAQVIVAAEITQQTNDSRQLVPMIKQVVANAGSKPIAVSADAGYWSEANVTDEGVAGVGLYFATGRQKHGEKQTMAHKLRTEAGKSIYKMRKGMVEPVFGQIKERRGFRRFSFRGVGNVSLDWKLICLTGNILKLFRSGWLPQTV